MFDLEGLDPQAPLLQMQMPMPEGAVNSVQLLPISAGQSPAKNTHCKESSHGARDSICRLKKHNLNLSFESVLNSVIISRSKMFVGIGRYWGDNTGQMGRGQEEDPITRDSSVNSLGPCCWLANHVNGIS